MSECERRFKSVCNFLPAAEPTQPLPGYKKQGNPVPSELQDKMQLHRALLRGNGFYSWMTANASNPSPSTPDITEELTSITPADKGKAIVRSLPVVNYFRLNDDAFTTAIVQEALPADQKRFKEYMSNRVLGLGIITAVST